ncbi:Gfo/Idh/MocA family protein [Humibacter ginsenosidimutans]|uniref:Gfo/Idh/MocA family oxidoreductase n=1 Tax=Humibacter ginsenosidimutans TaxID=2599293 RepID=A0A5B8M7D3_9MICO|nr:Gfo/Idh/MocA family oxidoreductase [Humibacter ginsenosidimutans]QDZ16099.1 Gfo/Idh/MocA family oxidoreductase [Humibacter ginsenosidimutans]
MTSSTQLFPVPTIQVGLGPWGQDWAKNVLPHAAGIEVIACVDSNESRLEEHTALPGDRKFVSLREALESIEADAVLITARIEAHYDLAREALLAGKHVLLEKPYTVTVAEAEDLNALSAERGLILCVAQNYRFWPVVATVADLLSKDAIGELRNVRLTFRRDHGAYPPALAAPDGSATGSVLYQISVHHFDLVRALLGEIADVDARRWVYGNLPGRLTAFSATIELESGLLVEYSADQVSHAPETPWSSLWEMEGSRGVIRWAGNATASADDAFIELTTDESGRVDVPVADLALTDRQAVVAEFVDLVRHGGDSAISGSVNVKTIISVAQAVGSMQEHGR